MTVTPTLSEEILRKLQGAFIVVDGMNGSGKTTQARRLVALLRQLRSQVQGLNYERVDGVEHFREPGGTTLGETLRTMLISPSVGNLCHEAQALMFMASRAQLVQEQIKPLKEGGYTIVCDRWASTTFAYQGGGGGMDYVTLDDIYDAAVPDAYRPDLILVLDVETAEARRRITSSPGGVNRWREMPDEFYTKVREGYRKWHDMYPDVTRTIDANAPEDEIFGRIVKEIETFFSAFST